MKTIVIRIIILLYIVTSMAILLTGIAYPFALQFEDAPPIWTCWVLYPSCLVIMASQKDVIEWCNKYF